MQCSESGNPYFGSRPKVVCQAAYRQRLVTSTLQSFANTQITFTIYLLPRRSETLRKNRLNPPRIFQRKGFPFLQKEMAPEGAASFLYPSLKGL
jgi:hypothetical protein